MMKKLIILFVIMLAGQLAFTQTIVEPFVTANKVQLDSTVTDSLYGSFWLDGTELKVYSGSGWTVVGGSTGLTDPMTTRGDIIIRNAANATARLGVGTNGQVLKSDGTDVSWGDDVGFADPMTTRGDIIIRNAANATARLAVGANTYVLTSDGTDVSWAAPSGGDTALLDLTGTVLSPKTAVTRFDVQGDEFYYDGWNVSTGTGSNLVVGGSYGLVYGRDKGSNNTSFGGSFKYINKGGNYNIGIGANTLDRLTTGDYNVAIGFNSSKDVITGGYNTAIGAQALNSNTGSENSALGAYAGYTGDGSGCVYLGYNAGYNETGSNKLYIENSNSSTPLIYGEFDNDIFRINGKTEQTQGTFGSSDQYTVNRAVTHSDGNWYELFINGSTTRLTVPDTSAWLFTIQVIGITDDAAKQWGYTVSGLIERDGSDNTTLAGSSVVTLAESDADFDCRVSADDTNEALLVEVTDATSGGDTVRWVATIRVTEVSY